jgi:hypothetical protein
MNGYDDYSGDDLHGYNDWGINQQWDFYADEDMYWDYDSDDHEDYDPADDIIGARDLTIEVTEEGFLLERETLIYADGHEELSERILEIGCWDGELPF